jgi:hypothetical protein
MTTKPTPEEFTSGLIGKAYGPLVTKCKNWGRLYGSTFIIVDTAEPLDSWVYRVPTEWPEEHIDVLVWECCHSTNWRWI